MPDILQNVLDKMGQFSRPQARMMVQLVLAILALRGKVNYCNLSRYSSCCERTYRRFFSKIINFCRLNQVLIDLYVPESHGLLGVMDASFIAKSGQKTFGRGFFYHGCQGRSERGLEVSLIAVVDIQTQDCYALNAQQTYAKAQNPNLSQTDYAILQLEATRPYFAARVRYWAVDAAYGKERFVRAALQLQLQVISKLRCNAHLLFLYRGPQKRRGAPRKYAGKVDCSDLSQFQRVTLEQSEEPELELYTQVVWSVALKRKIRLVYVLKRLPHGKSQAALLFSTDVDQSALEILQWYRLRFHLEFVFRDAKQFTGLLDCQARHEKALDFHYNISFIALNVAKIEQRLSVGLDQPMVFSMASIKRRAFNAHFLNLIIHKLGLSEHWVKSHKECQNLLNYGVIHS